MQCVQSCKICFFQASYIVTDLQQLVNTESTKEKNAPACQRKSWDETERCSDPALNMPHEASHLQVHALDCKPKKKSAILKYSAFWVRRVAGGRRRNTMRASRLSWKVNKKVVHFSVKLFKAMHIKGLQKGHYSANEGRIHWFHILQQNKLDSTSPKMLSSFI